MPTMIQTTSGKVTGLWGKAMIRGADGKMRPLNIGDYVVKGDVLLTTQDGIVQLTPEQAPTRTAGDLDDLDPPGAGAAGGSLQEGLRVGRVAEATTVADLGQTTFIEAQRIGPSPSADIRLGPVADPNSLTVNEDSILPVVLTGRDPDGNVVSFTVVTVPTGGLLTKGDGTPIPPGIATVLTPAEAANLVFVPAPNFNGNPGNIEFFVTDDSGFSSPQAPVAIAVTPVNDAPVAGTVPQGPDNVPVIDPNPNVIPGTPNDPFTGNYRATTPEDTPVSGRINATDVDGDTLTYAKTSDPANGTVTVNPDGSWTYVPSLDYNGPDQFVVTVSDGNGGTDTSTVFINVTPVEDNAPPAGADTVRSTPEDTPLTLQPNDFGFTDPNPGDTLAAVRIDTLPAKGSLVLDGVPVTPGQLIPVAAITGGGLTYQGLPNENGSPYASFTFSVQDPSGLFDPTPNLLTLNVTPLSDTPVAGDDVAVTPEDTPISIDVLANDSDADPGDVLTIVAVNDTPVSVGSTPVPVTDSNGTPVGAVTLTPQNTLLFTPVPDYNGPATFTYTITDGLTPVKGTVDVTVTPVNDAPVAQPDVVNTPGRTAGHDPGAAQRQRPGRRSADHHELHYQHPDRRHHHQRPDARHAGLHAAARLQRPGHLHLHRHRRQRRQLDHHRDGQRRRRQRRAGRQPRRRHNQRRHDAGRVGAERRHHRRARRRHRRRRRHPDCRRCRLRRHRRCRRPAAGRRLGQPGAAPGRQLHLHPVCRSPGLDDGESQVDVFSYTATDSGGLTATTTLTITVTGINDGPVAIDDRAITPENTPITLPVLGNDSDPDGDPLTITALNGSPIVAGTPVAINDPSSGLPQGTVTLTPEGTLRFVPQTGFNGPLSFTYTISDGTSTDTATVNLTVDSVNDPPVANPDLVTGPEDTVLTFDPRSNDADPENDPLTITAINGTPISPGSTPVTLPEGQLSMNPDGTLSFTPNLNFNGPVTFGYTLSDGALTDTSTVNILIAAVNDPPAGADAVRTTQEDTPYVVRASDFGFTDVDVGDSLSAVRIDTLPADGSLTLNGVPVTAGQVIPVAAIDAGQLSFIGAQDESGAPYANLTFSVRDQGGLFDPQPNTLTFNVTPLSDTPVAGNDVAVTPEDTPITIDVLANDGDADPDDVLTIVAVNGTPVTVGGPSVPLTATDNSPLGSVSLVVQDGKQQLLFTPAPNYNGPADFSYTITDGLTPVTAQVAVTVTPVNDPPLAVNDSVNTPEDVPVVIPVLRNDSDIDGDPLTITGFTQPTNGTVAIDPVSGNPRYTPNTDYQGADSFTYTITDGQGGSSTATVNLTVGGVNDAPLANPDTGSTNEDTVLVVNAQNGVITGGAGADTDPEGDSLTVGAVGFGGTAGTVGAPLAGAWGSLLLRPDGSYTYTPSDAAQALRPNDTRTDVFTYTATDGGGLTSSTTLTINVTGLNDAPVADDEFVTTPENTPITIAALDGDTDPENDPLSITQINGSNVTAGTPVALFDPTAPTPVQIGSVTLQPDNTLRFTPASGYNGPVSFSYTVSDGSLADQGQVTIQVDSRNDPPDAIDDRLGSRSSTTFFFDPRANDKDPDNDQSTLRITQVDGKPIAVNGTVQIDEGTITLLPNGTLSFDPRDNFFGPVDFPYTIADPDGLTDSAVVSFTITDDRPSISAISSPTATEGNVLDFQVTLSNSSPIATQLTFTLQSGTATVGVDTGTPQVLIGGVPVAVTTNADGTLTVNLPANTPVNALVVRVPTVVDGVTEPAENLTLLGTSPKNPTPASGIGTINDGDGTPTLSITGPALIDEGAGTATYTVTLSNPSSIPITVSFGTANGTALAGSDYAATSGSLTFAPGSALTQTITVAITDDDIYEGPETFAVNLANATNATIAVGSAASTIVDDGTGPPPPPPPGPPGPPPTPDDDRGRLTVSSTRVSEGALALFTVGIPASAVATLVKLAVSVADPLSAEPEDLSGPVVVSYVSGGTTVTLTAAADGTYTVPAGVTGLSVAVPTVQDSVYEGDETFSLTATSTSPSVTNGAAGATGTGTIVDDGSGPPSPPPPGSPPGTPPTPPDDDRRPLTVNNVEVSEGAAAVFTVGVPLSAETTLVKLAVSVADPLSAEPEDLAGPFTVSYVDSTGATQSLTVAADGTVTVPAGVTGLSVAVPTTQDNVYEGDETFSLTATSTSPSVTNGVTGATGTGTIVDDGSGPPSPPPPGSPPGTPPTPPDDDRRALTVNNVEVSEGAAAVFTVGVPLSAEPTLVKLAVSVADPLSAEPEDLAGPFTVSYVNSTGAIQPLTVAADGTVTVPSGVTGLSVAVPTTQDNVYEGDETFSLTATSTSPSVTNGATGATGTGTIVDDGTGPPSPPPPGSPPGTPPTPPDDDRRPLTVNSVEVSEGAAAVFTVGVPLSAEPTLVKLAVSVADPLSAEPEDLAGPFTVSYVNSTGAIQPLTVAADGTVTVPSGVTGLSVAVPTTQDNVYEGDETFSLTATSTSPSVTNGATGATGTGTIVDDGSGPPSPPPPGSPPGTPPTPPDDDRRPLTVNNVEVSEGAAAVFTVGVPLSAEPTLVKLAVSVADPLSAEPEDLAGPFTVSYVDSTGATQALTVAADGTVTVPAGVTGLSVAVPTTQDNVYEGDETFSLTATSTSPSVTNGATGATGTGTIVDDGSGPPSPPPPGSPPGTPPTPPDDDRRPLTVNNVEVSEGAAAVFTVGVPLSAEPTLVKLAVSVADPLSAEPEDLAGPFTVSYVDSTGAIQPLTVAADGTVTVPAGVTGLSVAVPTTQDNVYEGDETFSLTATSTSPSVTNGATGATGTGTIVDDGSGPPSPPPPGSPPGTPPTPPDDDRRALTVNNVEVSEGAAAVFTVGVPLSAEPTLIKLAVSVADPLSAEPEDLSGPFVVSYVSGGTTVTLTAAADGTYTVPAGVTGLSVAVPTTQDLVYEGDETFSLTATSTSPSVTNGATGATGTGTIVDDGSGPPSPPPPGSPPGTPPTPPDDDRRPLTVNSVEVSEGAAAVFTVGVPLSAEPTLVKLAVSVADPLSAEPEDLAGPFTVSYVDSTGATQSLTVATDGTVTVPAGVTGLSVAVPTTQDNVYEGDETFSLTATSTSPSVTNGATGATGTGTIVDDGSGPPSPPPPGSPPGTPPTPPDDDRPSVTGVSSPTAIEGQGLNFTVTLSNPSTTPTTVNLTPASGTGTLGTDTTTPIRVSFDGGTTFTNVTGTSVLVPASATSFIVNIPTVNDTALENAETITLGAATVRNSAPLVGTGTILDNDAVPNTQTILEDTVATGNVLTNDLPAGSSATLVLTGFTVAGVAGSFTAGQTATIANVGQLQVNANGGYTFTPVLNYNGTVPLVTYTGTRTETAGGLAVPISSTLAINVTPVNDVPVVSQPTPAAVQESALPAGTNPGSPNESATGTMAVSDPDSTSFTWSLTAPITAVTSGGVAVVWTPSNGGQTLTGTANGQPVATISINNNGQYTFTLQAAIDHPPGGGANQALPIQFTASATDNGGLSGNAPLIVNVQDDQPGAVTPPAGLTSTIANTNLMFILDLSGSMNEPSGINGLTRLQAAVDSITRLVERYDALGEATVRLVTFGNTGSARDAAGFSNQFLDLSDPAERAALSSLLTSIRNNPPPNDTNTNYDAALGTAINAFAAGGKIAGAQNVSYFLSDGLPTANSGNNSQLLNPNNPNEFTTNNNDGDNGIQPAEEALWTNFLVANNLQSYAIGIGTGIAAGGAEALAPVAYDGAANENRGAQIVTNFAQLDSVLAATVPAPLAGNLVGSLTTGGAGADGGIYVRTVVIDGTTYEFTRAASGTGGTLSAAPPAGVTFDTTTAVLTVNSTATTGGRFVLDFDDGTYRYENPQRVGNEGFGYTLADRDGDQTSLATLQVAVVTPAAAVNGSAAGNTLTGTVGVDTLYGNDGNDTLNGLAGNDRLFGGNGNDAVNGGDGNDELSGGAGTDVLNGGTGDDQLFGGPGSDTLTGGAGSDVFAWRFADQGANSAGRAVDVISDFNVAPAASGGDVLDLRDMLQGDAKGAGTGNLQNYLDFNFNAATGDTEIRISTTGGFSNGTYSESAETQRITLTDVNLRTDLGLAGTATDNQIIAELLNRGKLITD